MKEIYQVLAAAVGQENRLAHIANNLANVSTAGFKRDEGVFENYLKAASESGGAGQLDGAASIARYGHDYTDFSDGPAVNTGSKLDVMIEGSGFFEVEGPNSTKLYTRAGDFRMNANGDLVTADGSKLLNGSGSPITLQPGDGMPSIEPDGSIHAGTKAIGKIQVLDFDDKTQLVKQGKSLFAAPADAAPKPAPNARLRQGFVEGSNTNTVEEMVRMIETQRAYEVQQKAMRSIDDLVGERISQILNG